jgi:hypothetical protein
MGVHEGRGQLAKSIKELTHRWMETKSVWDDPVSRRLEEELLHPLESDLRNAVGAMDRVGVLLATIRRECAADD